MFQGNIFSDGHIGGSSSGGIGELVPWWCFQPVGSPLCSPWVASAGLEQVAGRVTRSICVVWRRPPWRNAHRPLQ